MRALPELGAMQQCVLDALMLRSDGHDAERLVRGGPLAPTRRLRVYRNNLFASLTGALQAVYPVTRRLVGDEFFGGLAWHYVQVHPSRSGNLQDFGAELLVFLRGFEPAAALPYLPDVAQLEWAYHEAYHEAEAPPLTLQRLAALPPEAQAGMQLQLQSSARLLSSPYPILRIWQAHQPNAESDGPISLGEGGVRLLVMQRALEVQFLTLGVGEHAWLLALQRGTTLGAATAEALAADPAFDLRAVLGRHLTQGSFMETEP